MKIINFRGDLTDNSAKKEALVIIRTWVPQWPFLPLKARKRVDNDAAIFAWSFKTYAINRTPSEKRPDYG